MQAGQLHSRWRRLRAYVSPPYRDYLERAVGDAESLLDVGCGVASPLRDLSRKLGRSVGVDAFESAVEESRAAGTYTDVKLLDVREIGREFPPRSFDVVAAIDVLEHLSEHDGLQLLDDMERIARLRVVVFTPNGFVPQEATEGNPWQVHRSGWTAGRMRELGYDVRGVHGMKWLRTELAAIRLRPRRLWHLVSDLTQPLAYRLPAVSFQLLCVKEAQRRVRAR